MGREHELRSIARGFQSGQRMQTLVGPPGIGKTRLAAEYLASEMDTNAESVWISLDGDSGDHGLHVAVARALGLDTDDASTLDRVIEHALQSRPSCLLVLDHIDEHVDAAATALAQWLTAAPSARFLATSCHVVRFRGETPIEVGPLPEPDAIACLRALSRRAFSDDDAPTLAELARQLDGIPLALELAASRLAVLSPRELLDRLSARFDVLTVGPRDANARHATLRAAIDWSWNHLDPDEQRVLAQCAAFRGGFTMDAAESVVDCDGAVVDVVQSLIEKSMLRASHGDATVRFDFFGTIREYVTTQTSRAADLEDARRRHLRHFANLARQQLAPDVNEDDALARSNAELQNLVAAWRAATTPADETDLLRALGRAILNRRPAQQYHEMLTEALSRHTEPSVERGHLLVCRSRCFQRLGRYADAKTDVAEALATLPTDPALDARVQWRLGVLARVDGDDATALTHLTAALEGARATANRTLQVQVLEQLAYCHARMARLREGLECADEALACAREVDSTSLGAEAHNARLLLLARGGRFAEGLDAHREATALYEATGQLVSVGYANVSVALIHQERGDYDVALAHLNATLDVATQLGVARLQALAHGNLGAVHHEADDHHEAGAHYRQAIELYRSLDDRDSEAEYQAHLCALLAMTGDTDGARRARARVAELAPSPPPHMRVAFDLFGAQIEPATPALGAQPPAAVADTAARSEVVRCARRLLQRTLRRTALAIDADGAWFALPGQPRTELHKRIALSRLLAALFARYLEAPGEAVSVGALLAAGWPNERMTDASAVNRLKNAMSTLRKFGLGHRVVGRDRGYLLDPHEPIVCASWLVA